MDISICKKKKKKNGFHGHFKIIQEKKLALTVCQDYLKKYRTYSTFSELQDCYRVITDNLVRNRKIFIVRFHDVCILSMHETDRSMHISKVLNYYFGVFEYLIAHVFIIIASMV